MENIPKILVTDDNPITVKMLENLLHKEGFQVIIAFNGGDCRRKAEKEKPDLIILDIVMPGEDGFQTCEQLKKNAVTMHIPVIFISGLEDTENKIKGLTVGGHDYITKPFEPLEVLARIRIQLKIRQAYIALIEQQKSKLQQLSEAQKSILISPETLPQGKFAVYYRPLNEAGGDFYDVIKIAEGIFAYFVGDISGHDLKASFITSALKVLLKQNSHPTFTPMETMNILNHVIRTVLSEGQYLTACYAHLNRKLSKLTLVGAGHPPILFFEKEKETIFEIKCEGDPLGAFDSALFYHEVIQVNPKDRFIIYSDGFIEGTYKGKLSQQQGIANLKKIFAKNHKKPIDEMTSVIAESIWPSDTKPNDDLLLLGVEI